MINEINTRISMNEEYENYTEPLQSNSIKHLQFSTTLLAKIYTSTSYENRNRNKASPLFFLGVNNKKNDLVNREESPFAPIDTCNRDANASGTISSSSLRFQQWHRSEKKFLMSLSARVICFRPAVHFCLSLLWNNCPTRDA